MQGRAAGLIRARRNPTQACLKVSVLLQVCVFDRVQLSILLPILQYNWSRANTPGTHVCSILRHLGSPLGAQLRSINGHEQKWTKRPQNRIARSKPTHILGIQGPFDDTFGAEICAFGACQLKSAQEAKKSHFKRRHTNLRCSNILLTFMLQRGAFGTCK